MCKKLPDYLIYNSYKINTMIQAFEKNIMNSNATFRNDDDAKRMRWVFDIGY